VIQKLRPFLYPVLILVVTLSLALLLWAGVLPDQLITLRTDLGNLFLILGLVIALSWSGLVWVWERRQQRSIDQVKFQVSDEKRRFLRRLDHELKNPLTAIRAGLANLAETSLDEAQNRALISMEAQTVRLSRLLSDLRKLAELETRPLERSAVDVNEMLKEAYSLALAKPNATGRDLKLTVPQAPWPLSTIQGDPDLLFLAVHNLLDNAIKFTQPGCTIEIRGFEDGAFLAIEVADTGQGIPQDEIAHIGEELYRGRGARGIPGNGLGLALVNSIVNLHGGRMSLRSREGMGTVVTLRLPVN
jgi:two-component system OmpR family sensor kinase